MRLQKYMAQAGLASRRQSEKMITEGRVTVNGAVVTEMGTQVEPGDKVTVDGHFITPEQDKVYLILYKPDACVSTRQDPEGRETVFNYVPSQYRLFTCGRLDYHTQGLLLFTNDGDLANHLSHPRYQVEKEYCVTVEGEFTYKELQALRNGLDISEPGAAGNTVKTAPALVRRLEKTDKLETLSITIHEGRNRQVRRMMEALGKKVVYLLRMRQGELTLAGLQPGGWRHVTQEERKYLENLK